MRRSTIEIIDFYQNLRVQYPNAIMIGCYGSSLKEAALNFGVGMGWSQKIMDALAQMYPSSYLRNVVLHRFVGFKGEIFANDILAQGRMVILIEVAPDCINGPFLLRKLGEVESQKAYELVGTVEKEAYIYYVLAVKSFMQGDNKTALDDALKSKSLRFTPPEKIDGLIKVIVGAGS
jgi:hypothetical protein